MPDSSFIDTLAEALGNSDDQLPDEIRKELREEGVDVDGMEKRLREFEIKLGHQQKEQTMDIKTARKFMNKELQDESLRETYRANIAMLIYDDQMAGIESRSIEPPTPLSTNEGCNSLAERIINLVFG